jgi:transcriptional adapter 2-alpha
LSDILLVLVLAAPLNLANSPSLHLLTPAEQTLCSQLRILPKPYLAIKETLVREYARRGGKLRRREARDLVKIDVNKTSRVWDFLVQAGFLKITQDLQLGSSAGSGIPSINGSPVKDPPRSAPTMTASSSMNSQAGSLPSTSMASTPTLPSSSSIPLWPSR